MQQKRTICCYICKNILGIAKHGREANFCDHWKLFEYADLHRQLPIPIGKRKMLARALARPLMTTAGEILAFDKSLLLLALIRYIQTNQLCSPSLRQSINRLSERPLIILCQTIILSSLSGSSIDFFRLLIEGAKLRSCRQMKKPLCIDAEFNEVYVSIPNLTKIERSLTFAAEQPVQLVRFACHVEDV